MDHIGAVFLADLVDLQLHLSRLNIRVRLARGSANDVDAQPLVLHIELTNGVTLVLGAPHQGHSLFEDSPAGAVPDRDHSGDPKEGLVDGEAAPIHRMVDPNRLCGNLRAILVQDKFAGVILRCTVRIVGICEGLCFNRKPSPFTKGHSRAHCYRDLGVLKSGGGGDEDAKDNDHETDMGNGGPERSPTEPIGVEVEGVIARVGAGSEAVRGKDLSHLL